jgi:hypothetical protein
MSICPDYDIPMRMNYNIMARQDQRDIRAGLFAVTHTDSFFVRPMKGHELESIKRLDLGGKNPTLYAKIRFECDIHSAYSATFTNIVAAYWLINLP